MQTVNKLKQVLVMRADLKMSPGKLAAQAAHASIGAYEVSDIVDIDEWRRNGVTKIVLAVESEQDLIEIYKVATAMELPVSLICDEGRTEVNPGTITAVGIGPAQSTEINQVTGGLPLYGYKK